MILVKLLDPTIETEVTRLIKEKVSGIDILTSRDLPRLFARGTPVLNRFLEIVIALSVIVSALVILLSMYATIIERTRHIGILKSLGASRFWIATEIEKEAMVICLTGALVGVVISAVAGVVIEKVSGQQVELQPRWLVYTLMMSIVSGIIGALYPALRAANQDPVRALACE